jgi:TPR repeat protein
VATAQLAEADPVLAAATVPIETKLPALIEARQPGFSAPKQDTQEFREQGEALLASGDIVSARRFFEYAANRGDTAAATQAGKTYDPYFLRRAGARGIPGDSDKATYWYRQAAGNGDPEAAANLKRLLNQRR